MLNKNAIISATGLRKSYGAHLVLDSVGLTVAQGTIFALLGPNGAGKTTIVQILSTLIKADAGEIRVACHDLARDPDAVRAEIGVTGQFSAVDDLLTGQENLRLMADLLHVGRSRRRRTVQALLERFDLAAVARKPVASYSGGLRRRLDLAMTMVGAPRLIFLDEPTTGLDPRSRRELWRTVRDLVENDGVTVFLTTQYLEEADQLADRVALLSEGRLVAEGTPDELKRLIPGGHIAVRFADDAELTVQIPDGGVAEALRAVVGQLDAIDAEVAGMTVHTPGLDDVFLALTKSSSR
ncbi:ATP-binding cassette domain-containing protein [Streptomyces sp. SDr-06]|uniref:ATP-binding cassette domain-containing protein n=1 Tax=Streptomyces sp. SDr-06 TaxID=2267702 RepID=UPI000DEA8441|nr:ATP-binding cassette domain-containing protein [Streptomyces sp. SDr-06]RCH59680.1 ATP-binding cassette domain-containing protein [Streptomyces sp. SDr-06]